MPVYLAIADDKPINRQTVKDKIAGYAELKLLIEARNGRDLLEQLKDAKQKPDVVLIDLEMPEMDGIETIGLASAAYPDIKFIVLTVFEDNDRIFEAIKAGASGYLLKDDTAVNIVDAITNVYEYNGIPMSPGIARKAMELLRQMSVQSPVEPSGSARLPNHQDAGLSDREMDVLKALVSGKNYKAIGEILFISPLTVRKHVTHIYEKLHVNCRAQVINIAHSRKWI